AGELRYRGRIERLPVVGPRVEMLWRTALFDAILNCLVCILSWIEASNLFTSSMFSKILSLAAIAWLVTHLAGALAAGWLGTALATMLWYTWARWECVGERSARAAGAVCALVLVL